MSKKLAICVPHYRREEHLKKFIPHMDEFFKGKGSVRKLTIWDWTKWFNLKIPVEKVDIRIDNNVAWIEVIGESGPWRDGKTYEIRMVGSLLKNKNKWVFRQICFSYPAPLKIIE